MSLNQASHWSQLTSREQNRQLALLAQWNETQTEYPAEKTVIDFLEQNAGDFPSKTALFFEGKTWTYQELVKEVNRYASALINKGIVPRDQIAVALDRSPEMLFSLLAVMKCGAAYIPVDPSYPQRLIRRMLDDCSARMLITSRGLVSQVRQSIQEGTIVCLTEEMKSAPDAMVPTLSHDGKHLAYIIYTSGSTGVPKGIAIEHRSLSNFLLSMQREPGISVDDRLLAITTISFDISGLELYLPLISGATLVLTGPEESRDARRLLELIEKENISIMQATPSGWKMLLELDWQKAFPLKALCGGEPLPADLAGKLLKRCSELWNMYGPTETTIWSTIKQIRTDDEDITIGRPIANTKIYITDDEGLPTPIGETGNLCIAGEGLARGYLNQPDLTAKVFIPDAFAGGKSLMYKTGDLGRYQSNGDIVCLGRVDNQVKIRGHRIELDAISTLLERESEIRDLTLSSITGDSEARLIAYVVTQMQYSPGPCTLVPLNPELTHKWRAKLREAFPPYMVPEKFVGLSCMPLLSNGKTDRSALPIEGIFDNQQRTGGDKPSGETERLLSDLWAEILGIATIGADENFFDLGGNSLLAVRFVALLEKKYQIILPVTRLYRHPVIRQLAAEMDGHENSSRKRRAKKHSSDRKIAIVGMSGRFPGAETIEAFWDVLREGRETVTFFKDEDLDPTIPEELKSNPDYVKARGILENYDQFDPAFFGINKRQAEIMDPQQRIFLEICWEALESAGCIPSSFEGRIGVFAGSGSNSYYQHNIGSRPDIKAKAGFFQISTLNDKDYLAMRVAYQLDLTGPAVSVYSSSSTSLLAIAQAVENLRQGTCDAALAGGVSMNSQVKSGHLYEEGTMFSRDGHTRPFDASATGTVFSDGAGVVLLKRLEDALEAGDEILAVISGVGVSNDGATKASFTAPHVEGQADAIMTALEDAGIDSSSVTYVEAHGTATPIGDPIEIEALHMAYSGSTISQSCAIGSVKGNIGHLTHAAGVAGVIKTVLSLQYRQLAPSLFFEKENPALGLAGGPFYVNTSLKHWESTAPRRAGISSFGMGGTNIHLIVEEAPTRETPLSSSGETVLLRWSAKSATSVQEYAERLAVYLKSHPDTSINAIAATLNRRAEFRFRCSLAASDVQELISRLQKNIRPVEAVLPGDSEIVFMFPGQGSQFRGMGKVLYALEPVYRAAVDRCAEILNHHLGTDIRKIMFEGTEEQINTTRYTQPALFVAEYAISQVWISRGIQPSALLGHSIGEFVAAQLSGIFSLEDVLQLVAARAAMINARPPGSMLAVKQTEEELAAILPAGLSIAAINSQGLTVVAGETNLITTLKEELTTKNIASSLLKTSHAFHSAMMDEVTDEFTTLVSSIKRHAPNIPIVSTATGKWMSEAEATDPAYWGRQLRLPVRFADALSTLLEEENRIFLEAGPGTANSVFVRQAIRRHKAGVLPGFTEAEEKYYLQQSLGRLWEYGINIPVDKQPGKGLALPSYAFDRSRYWIEPGAPKHEQQEFIAPNEAIDSVQEAPGQIRSRVLSIIESASGIDLSAVSGDMNFAEIGLDSLLLTQVALTLKKEFGTGISFRKLSEGLNTLDKLSIFIEQSSSIIPSTVKGEVTAKPALHLSEDELKEISKPFGASPKIERTQTELNNLQRNFLNDLISRYTRKTKKSKDYTQENRSHMADPRVVSGFRPATKEMVYPIVAKKSKGSRIWDLDDNEYIDALNGFGSNMLGYQPDVLVEAIKAQIDKGYEIGPQHELAADVCRLVCEFTGFDRAAVCSTGSEAVMGTMRIARTVTGRSLIVAFSGSYHGIFDEVVIRGTKSFRSIPAAAGIMPEAVQNMLILNYGTPESLQVIRERAHELAAVLVEPVQSRRPDFQPVDFLKEVRQITAASGTALIFDEVITGFRMHPGGAQALFGIRADISSYGKVIGGGLPIGVIAGKREFMDALDGGQWQFGDDSTPDAGVTYFAGTFVRHPLALASAQASLEYFRARGKSLQESLNSKGTWMINTLNETCRNLKLPMEVVGFGSLWRVRFKKDIPYSELLFTLMRDKGIHILDGFPCFMTESHTMGEMQEIANAFKHSAEELIFAGFLLPETQKSSKFVRPAGSAPVPGARLGRDRQGNPAWFVADPENPGKFLQIG